MPGSESQTYPGVTVCIVTRNRREDAMRAVESAIAQDYPNLRIHVYDNASEDDTAASLTRMFPTVHVVRSDKNLGAGTQRNRCFAETSDPYVLSIDDDSYFTDSGTVRAAVASIEAHPDVAALAMTFVEPAQRGMNTWTPPADPDGSGVDVRSFVACACMFRRDHVLAVGGYREFFRQWGEERDLSIRLMGHGMRVLYVPAPPIVHTGSTRRDRPEMEELGVRNTLLFDWLNIPCPYSVPRIAIDAVRLLLHKLRPGNVLMRLRFVASGLAAVWIHRADRQAVSRETYLRYRSLSGHGPVTALSELPPPLTTQNRGNGERHV